VFNVFSPNETSSPVCVCACARACVCVLYNVVHILVQVNKISVLFFKNVYEHGGTFKLMRVTKKTTDVHLCVNTISLNSILINLRNNI